ncbi:hypothetical protein Mycch_5794 (plasmid) [Mycolicibacterium chubuense NBB4]|uniref:Uncharacterized protein n=2 Tax=Mycolicibacterium TaxID=1866885 RepID=I4BT07_MYCCN|nr:hypothetical protein Mycch_5794 [Mycolicibacterium chubuense NBB4]KMO80304.1 hypothetical protein MCHLDSM_01694 [Mycolicibacterium chlorophenolicum]
MVSCVIVNYVLASPWAAVTRTRRAGETTGRRVVALLRLLDRADDLVDDVHKLRRSIQFIAENIGELTESAAGLNRNAGEIAAEIATLTEAAQGIDNSAGSLAQALPAVQRLTEIVDPLDNTVARLGRFVDRIPGGKRTPTRTDRWPAASDETGN